MSKGFDDNLREAFIAGACYGEQILAFGSSEDYKDWIEEPSLATDRDVEWARTDERAFEAWRRRWAGLEDADADEPGSEVAVASEPGSDFAGSQTTARASSYPRQGGSEAGCYS